MMAIKVITAEFGVSLIALQNMKDDHQQSMGYSHQGFLAAQSLEQAKVLTAQIAVLLHADTPSGLHQSRTQVSVTFAGASRQPFTASSFVAGTNASPTGQVRRISKDSHHLDPNLGNDYFRYAQPDSRNAVQN